MRDTLRFITCGSVDDGKSTLIGRLLWESKQVFEDHLSALERDSTRYGTQGEAIDLALLVDGLQSEREQSITIDVAYRFFATPRRRFVVADTPGHEQYTRNMATGASTADLAIILIDARKGILTQSRRHAYIASLLGIRRLVAAINKMDLVGFSAEVFHRIERDFREMVRQIEKGQTGETEVQAIPVSALEGDNVVTASSRMPWYRGPALLRHLEDVPAAYQTAEAPFRLPVQRAIRPNQHFRGFAGQIAAGTVRPGDRVVILPSGRTTRIASISTFDGELDRAAAPQSVTVTLEDELDVSRGDCIASAEAPPQSATNFEAELVWFDSRALDPGRSYRLKHGAQTINARVSRIRGRVDMQTLEESPESGLAMNDIGVVEIELPLPIFFDPYRQSRAMGSFILIDPESNATAAAGMIRNRVDVPGTQRPASESAWPHRPAILLTPAVALSGELERDLLLRGCAVVRTRVHSAALWRSLLAAGAIVIVEGEKRAGGEPPQTVSAETVLVGTGSTGNGELRLEPLFAPAQGEASRIVTAEETIRALENKKILDTQPSASGEERA